MKYQIIEKLPPYVVSILDRIQPDFDSIISQSPNSRHPSNSDLSFIQHNLNSYLKRSVGAYRCECLYINSNTVNVVIYDGPQPTLDKPPIHPLLRQKLQIKNIRIPAQKVAIDAIIAERVRQDEKWGERHHDPHKWMAIMGEEVGEANKAALEDDLKNFKEELTQIAAVAVSMLEDIENGHMEKFFNRG